MKNNYHFYIKLVSECILTIFIVTILSFFLMRISPIDPATAYAKRNSAIVTDEQIDVIRKQLGMDSPLLIQYGKWIYNSIHLNFGVSLKTGSTVAYEMSKAIPPTLCIVLIGSIIMFIGMILLGMLQYKIKNKNVCILVKMISIIGVSVPPFYLGILFLDYFAVNKNFLKVTGNVGMLRYLPVAICISISGICFYSQMLESALHKESYEDYVMYSRCRGLSENRILCFSILPNALFSLLPSFFQTVGLSIASVAIVERIFSLPGVGYLMIDAVINRDSPLIHAIILFLTITIVFFDALSRIIRYLCIGKTLRAGDSCE